MNFVKSLIWGTLLFLLGQILVWYQINGQYINEWVKKNPLMISLLVIHIRYIYIYATRHLVNAFNGELWPQRLIGFAMGMIAFAFLTWFHLEETITTKTAITLILSLVIVLIQILWR